MTKYSRRQFIITAGAATATSLLAHGCSTGPLDKSGGSKSAASTTAADSQPIAKLDPPEVKNAKLGFIALTDAAPLIVAQAKGYFKKYGMDNVEVVKQASWPVTRDNLELGSGGGGIDGAHILSPMPYLMTIGKITKQPVPMYLLARLNTNGQAISVSNTYKDLKLTTESKGLKEAFAKSAGKGLKAAMTFPGGTHDLWMRYWLAAGGIDPDKDISVVPVPPAQMVANMKVQGMEAFCVGEPWNAQLINQQLGYTALITGELWKDHPEKAFTMRKDWVDKNPKAAKAILVAVMEAQQWCDKPENKDEMVKIIADRQWLKVPEKDIIDRTKGKIDYGTGRVEANSPVMMKFWADNASYPYKSHDIWFITENKRWGYIPADVNAKELVDKVNRSDLWKDAAKALGGPDAQIPTRDSRGVETFFDGVKFDPEKPDEYLKSLKIKKA